MTGRRLLTASGLERALSCQYWLRSDVEIDPQSGRSAAIGTEVHSKAEVFASTGKELTQFSQHFDIDEILTINKMYDQWKAWFEDFPIGIGDVAQYETKFAYNPTTGVGRRIKTKKPRDYGDADPETELAGTIDMMVLREAEPAKLVEIFDYKTGKHPVPPDSPQLLLAALAFGDIEKSPYLFTYILRVLKTKTVLKGPHEFVPPAQAEFRTRLQQLMTTPISDVQPTVGEHCRFCPARNSCPAQSRGI